MSVPFGWLRFIAWGGTYAYGRPCDKYCFMIDNQSIEHVLQQRICTFISNQSHHIHIIRLM